MELAYLSLGISALVAGLNVLNFVSNKSEKFARAEVVDNELGDIKDDILNIYEELDAHQKAISALAIQNGVSNNEHEHTANDIKQILLSLERMLVKIEGLR